MISNIALVIASAVLYRMGGTNIGTKWRDFGVPLCVGAILWLNNGWHWCIIPTVIALFGALTTYCKKKGTEAKAWNWYLTGLLYAISICLYGLIAHNFVSSLIILVVLPLSIMAWSEWISKDWLEEAGRGLLIALSTILLLKKRK